MFPMKRKRFLRLWLWKKLNCISCWRRDSLFALWTNHYTVSHGSRRITIVVYSIVNEEPNAEECKSRIKAYEEANRAQIVIRQSQRADEERSIQDRIAAEQREAELRKRELNEEKNAKALAKRKLKQESTEVLLGVRLLGLRILCDENMLAFKMLTRIQFFTFFLSNIYV